MFVHVCMHVGVCVYVCMCVCMCVCTCMCCVCVCMSVHMCMHVHVQCMCVHVCVCACVMCEYIYVCVPVYAWASEQVRQVRRPPDQYFPKEKIYIYISLANMGMGTGDVDPPFRLTCYDNVYNNNDIYVHRLKRNGFHSLDIIVRSFFFCVCHLSRRFPFPKRSFGSKGETRSFRAEPVV